MVETLPNAETLPNLDRDPCDVLELRRIEGRLQVAARIDGDRRAAAVVDRVALRRRGR